MIDFYRTLSDLAGLPKPPEYVKGVSLKPVLQNISKSPRLNSFTQLVTGYTLRTRDFRVTMWKEGAPDNYELYDQRNDPEEMVNLAKNPEYRKDLAKLKKQLGKRIVDATARPKGLVFTAPDPKDRGVQKTYE
jgi:arylsulfatase A-like enzyme